MTLSPKARRAAAELEEAIAEGDTARVVERVEAYGLTRNERSAICRELDARARQERFEEREEFRRLVFNRFDLARVEEVKPLN